MIITTSRCNICWEILKRKSGESFCSFDCWHTWQDEVGWKPNSEFNLRSIQRKLDLVDQRGWYECWQCKRMFFSLAYCTIGGPDDIRNHRFRRKEWCLLPDIRGEIAQVHHVRYDLEKDDSLSNLSLLCADCHTQIHKKKEIWVPKKPKSPTVIRLGGLARYSDLLDMIREDLWGLEEVLDGYDQVLARTLCTSPCSSPVQEGWRADQREAPPSARTDI